MILYSNTDFSRYWFLVTKPATLIVSFIFKTKLIIVGQSFCYISLDRAFLYRHYDLVTGFQKLCTVYLTGTELVDPVYLRIFNWKFKKQPLASFAI